jgi:indole-3-glycerol phosphate synthase
MNILDKIVEHKEKEIQQRKSQLHANELEKMHLFECEAYSLAEALKNSAHGIIAEFKRKSPSKDVINTISTPQQIAKDYQAAGATAMSVLTDQNFFGGSLEDLQHARAACTLPILRKEFIIDEYQILEAKAYGADAILLIAAILSKQKIKQYAELAKSIGLDVLLEVHNEAELEKSLMPHLDIIGVNNRNLKSFEVSLKTSCDLSTKIPSEFVKISESGISSTKAINELKAYGYQGFLIGECFMKTKNPGKAAHKLIQNLNHEA